KTGGFGDFKIVLEGASPEIRRQYAKTLSDEISKLNWVDFAEYKKGWEKIEKSKFLFVALEDLEEIYRRTEHNIQVNKNPIIIDFEEDNGGNKLNFDDIEKKYQRTSFGSAYFEDPNLLYTAIQVWPKGSQTNINFVKKGLNDLQNILKNNSPKTVNPELTATIGGSFRNKIDEYQSLINDIYNTALIAFCGILFLILFFYRRLSAAINILLPLVLGTLWCFGVTTLLVSSLNLLTVFLVAILLGLGVDYGIYLYSRFSEERASGKNLEGAISHCLFETGKATLSAALTTALAFFVLLFMKPKGFQEFGLLTFVSIWILFFTYMFFAPALWVLGEKIGLRTKASKHKLPTLLKKPLTNPKVLIIGLILILLGLVSLPFTEFEYDYGKLRSQSNTYWKVKQKIHDIFPLSKSPAIAIAGSAHEAKALVAQVRNRIPKTQTIDTVKSLVDFMPESQKPKKKILQKLSKLLQKNRRFMTEDEIKRTDSYLPYLEPPFFAIQDMPKRILRYFKGLEGNNDFLVFIYDKVPLSDGKWAIQYANDIQSFSTGNKTYYPAEGSVIFAQTLLLMKKEALVAFLVMLFGIYIILLLNFRSAKKALHVFFPLITGLLITFLLMWLLGLRLNIFNLVIFPILLGIGIDSALHLYHRFHEEGQNKKALQTMFCSTGNSLLLASTTTMVGFASMLAADHQGLKSIGQVALIGMACLLISSLLLYPAYLFWINKLSKK
ncbi:MAG: MMPL family transporter, partial [bacterium]